MADRIVKVPSRFAYLADALEKAMAGAETAAQAAEAGGTLDMAAIEREAERLMAVAERELLRGVLQACDIDRERIRVGDKAHAKVGRYEATYYTKAGAVTVTRSLYREVGKRNGKTVDPVSLRAGVVEGGWLPETAKAMAYLVQGGTSREAEATAKQLGRLPYSRPSFERVAHAVGALYAAAHKDVEEKLVHEMDVPAEAASVSVSLDRVSVPMEEPREKPVGRPKRGAPKKPIARNFRMAFCGTVTLHDGEGKALRTLRYGRMPQGDADDLCKGLAGDVLAFLEKRPDLHVATLVDGAAEMRNRLREELTPDILQTPVHELVDFWHAVEKLSAAAQVIAPSETEALRARWKLRLLNSPSAVGHILAELRQSGLEQVRVGEGRPVHDAITYLENNGERMDYASARKLGLPIGSGNVEATCKSLVAVRMKRPGSRWKESTGEHVIQLRALALSDRWDRGLELTLAPLRQAVA
jgi:hypothetical protein